MKGDYIDIFVELNWKHLQKTANNICNKNNSNDDPNELLNYCFLQLLEHRNKKSIIESGFGVYWLIKTMTNSIFSKSSKYHKQIRSQNFTELSTDISYEEPEDTSLEEKLVNEIEIILNKIEKQDIAGWYMVNLFKLWVEKKNISAISRETNIPRSSISDAVRGCKETIIKELKKRNIQYEF